ncbi:MAG: class I SAM-dependent methyltransferase [Vibrionaceae bacterium]
MSIDFYDQHACSFYASTVDIDSSSLLEQFIPYLPKGGSVLDAGCGSGRDSKRLIDLGFHVDAFDASKSMALLAQQLLGKPVCVATFMQFASIQQYDGIWACASLLHVAKISLPSTFAHLASMLRAGGAFYCSFKYGEGEVERDGRSFTQCNEALLAELLTDLPLAIDKVWLTTDLRVGREDEQWLNAVLLKR